MIPVEGKPDRSGQWQVLTVMRLLTRILFSLCITRRAPQVPALRQGYGGSAVASAEAEPSRGVGRSPTLVRYAVLIMNCEHEVGDRIVPAGR